MINDHFQELEGVGEQKEGDTLDEGALGLLRRLESVGIVVGNPVAGACGPAPRAVDRRILRSEEADRGGAEKGGEVDGAGVGGHEEARPLGEIGRWSPEIIRWDSTGLERRSSRERTP